ncbi:hypothetical protein Poli38472_010724 [Pythium oligandrum]|uniref:ABC transporter domain-containing protein n=1 Tax=Pythium oligandrum TaxID=41045 RepID=A0A8K1CF24_PYTOL|nr:hypothetical protein Poli38472_010724 [Pythium oligandrum]|eukprot:TMW61661.1 hypothetical protein Poli38472_010724 [Pythium oligandrum]
MERQDDYERVSGTLDQRAIRYSSANGLMAQGPEALHNHYSSRMEMALGKTMHQMEVRFRNVSITAEVAMASKSKTSELPTLANELKKMFGGCTAKTNTVTKHILKDVSGVFKPGTMTLILGQPGSGKSSLMKILCGRFPESKHIQIDGEINYNSATREEMKTRMPQFVSYVTQRDHHFATLTVKETLEFAHECCGGAQFSDRLGEFLTKGSPEENKAALEAVRALSEHYPDVIIQQLGLDNCQNTVVGDAMLRGISGGERKRVTTGEMQFGTSVVNFMDEISTGLDSAATYDIIKTQRSVAKNLRKTVVIALLQPSPEVFALFDDVIILNDGDVMYHGPVVKAVDYFRDLGFVCPPRRDVADYLLDLGTHMQHQYEVARPDGSKHPRKPSEFAEIFRRSSIYDEMMAYINGPHDPALLEDKEDLFKLVPEFHQAFWPSTATLIKREFKKMSRNTPYFAGRVVILLVIALLNASVFWQFDPKDPQVVLGIVFGSVLFFGLSQAAQMPVYISDREIFYRQRAANFYRSSSYVVANVIAQIPVSLVEAIIFGSIVYWMCGFIATAAGFFTFLLLLFLTSLAFTSLFFLMSAASPDLHVAEPISMVSVLFFVLFGGFVMTKDQIPDYFIWIYWMNPIAWGVRGLAINQYRNDKFDVCEFGGTNYCNDYGMKMGEYTLGLFAVESGKEWLWYGVIYLIAAALVCMSLAAYVLEHKRFEGHHNTTLSGENDELHFASTDSDSNSGSDETGYVLAKSPRGDATVTVNTSSYERRITPVTLGFRDLWYAVPDPANPKQDLELLKGINGFALPGKVTALMGSTGAGKTTLMDVIAGRKTGGKVRGQIFLNGHEATDLSIRRCTGYCEQMDIHSEASTIREALTFSAFLRQDSEVPDSAKFDSVEECLDLLDLRPIADQIIRGSSVEQMKRLTIGVELAAQPSVLFLDEPTSGLDARSAKLIMDGVRKVADSGRTIVCTIHQPSTEVFMLFDSLLLLKRGGQTVYFGDLGKDACELIQYFESVPGVDRIEDGYNPGTWMLEVIGAGVGNTANQDLDFVELFNNSEKAKVMEEQLDREGVGRPAPGVDAIFFTSKRAASELTQAKFVIKRFMDLYWRTPSYNLTRFMVSILVSLIFGLSFLSIDFNTYQGINAGEGMIFMTTLFIGAITYNSILPIAAEERASFYRERASQTYNALWYFIGGTIAEIPYVFGSTFFFVLIYFFMVGFTGAERFFLYWIVLSLHVLTQAYMGQWLAYTFPTVEVATIMGVLLISLFFQFMGFNPPSSSIPSGWKWLYQIDPPRFSFTVLSAIVFGDCPSSDNTTEMACQKMENLPPTVPAGLNVKEYVERIFLAKHSDIPLNIVYMIVIIVFFRILALLALRFINHQKK